MAISDDIIRAGIVASLSRLGTNTTGLTIMAPEPSAKRLEVLQEMVPRNSRVALAAMWRHAGTIVVKVLKSAKPADLPVE